MKDQTVKESYKLKGTELTAYCGLYCGDCIRYRSRASDLACDLLSELKNIEFNKYAEIKSSAAKQLDAVKQFEHYEKCREVLEAIATLQCSNSCRVGRGCPTFSCTIIECCIKKGYEGCWQCDGFGSCKRLENLKSIHGDSLQKNLKMIKKLGLVRWVEYRHKPYVWQR